MEISKSTPYVRYRENISSTLHKGTIHIESEYFDRERKTTIESIEGQTWQNMVNGENKEEDILPRLGLKIEGNEDVLDSEEQHMPIDTIIGDVEPVANEDGTYTYEISTMEGSYAKTLDGENNFLLTSDGLVGDMYIKYNAQGEEVNGSIVMDNLQSSYTIENSNTGEIKSAILKGQTLVNISTQKSSNTFTFQSAYNGATPNREVMAVAPANGSTLTKPSTRYIIKFTVSNYINNYGGSVPITILDYDIHSVVETVQVNGNGNYYIIGTTKETLGYKGRILIKSNATLFENNTQTEVSLTISNIMVLEYQEGMENWDIPYFEGMQSVKMPVLTTSNEDGTKTNILTVNDDVTLRGIDDVRDELNLLTGELTKRVDTKKLKDITFTFRDDLESETTYLISFGDASHYIGGGVGSKILSNITTTGNIYYVCETEGIRYDGWGLYLRIKKDRITEKTYDAVKQYFESTDATIQYQNKTESIKTVDLTIKDQDDKIIQSLHTHPSTTHINLSSDGLTPNAELSYTMYGNIGETTGEQITDGTDSKLIEGKIYGDTLCNVLSSPSLKNSMDDISMQKLNNGYDNINVADGEFKKATLYGRGQSQSQALPTNIFNNWENKTGTYTPTHTQDGYFLFTGGNIDIKVNLNDIPTFKRNVEYTFIFRIKNSTYHGRDGNILRMDFGSTMLYTDDVKTGIWKTKMSFSTSATNCYVRAYALPGSTGSAEISLQIIEGDYTNIDVPESSTQPESEPVVMPSLMTCGKNLFSGIHTQTTDLYGRYYVGNDTYTLSLSDKDTTIDLTGIGIGNNTPNTVNWLVNNGEIYGNSRTFTNSHFVYYPNSEETLNKLKQRFNIQIEKGSVATLYEPYKSNILTVNEDVELRGVGDVKDELDLMTGKLTQRVGEDGSVLPQEIVKTVDISIVDQDNQPQTALHSFANGYINVTSQGSLPKVTYEVPTSNSYYLDMVKTDTQYTSKSSSDCNATIDGTSYPLSANGTFTTPSTITDNLMVLDTPVNDLMFIEGDLTGRELDYFTGLQSVENPLVAISGKNLFDVSRHSSISYDGSLYTCQLCGTDEGSYYYLQPNTEYRIKVICDNPKEWFQVQYNGNMTNVPAGNHCKFTTDNTGKTLIKFGGNSAIMQCRNIYMSKVDDFIEENFMLPSLYVHLTTNEPIALHRIGDVKDELDLVNECVVRRIGEVVLDGSQDEDWRRNPANDGKNTTVFYINEIFGHSAKIIVDKFISFDTTKNFWTSAENDSENHLNNNSTLAIRILKSKLSSVDITGFKQWLSKNPVTVLYELETPTIEPVRIVPQNPKQSTVSLTLQSPLQKAGNVADQLRWNPYKGHYVRYNYIQDGVANSTYAFEDLKDMNERKFVNLYNQRTYIDTDHTVQVISHGLSRYCLAEQGKQYHIRWDWAEEPSVDTIKVDLCGNVKEIPSTDNSVVIDVEKFTHQFIQIQGLGLTGKITNLMVIETVNGEIPDVDFFSGIQCIGNVVQVDGVNKAEIVVEQTNGNLIDVDYEITNNGNNVGIPYTSLIRPNKNYILKTKKGNTDGSYCYVGDKNKNMLFSIGLGANEITEIKVPYNAYYFRFHKAVTSNGSVNMFYPFELCYADMAKDGIRPRYYDKESFILPQKLCRVGNIYDNLYYDDLKGYYRIQQSIGHKYFTGETTEVWTMETTNGYRTIKFTCTSANIDQIAYGETICNSFKHLSTINDDMEGFIIYNGNFVIRVDKDRLTDKTVDGFKALLSSNPIHLFYQLKTPQMINLTEYPNRIELNTYRDEIFTFFKGMNPTKFTLSVPMDKTYRYEIAEEGQGLANRVAVNNETISAENMVAIKEVRGQGIANIIEDVNNVVITPRPNHEGRTTSHTLNNTKPATIMVHGFEPSGDTAIGTYNTTDKTYQLKVMSSNGDNSLSDYYVLNVPYKLETYADGTKDVVYYDEAYKQWHFKGSSVKEYTVASNGTLSETIEIFRGLAPRSGMIAEFKLMFTSGTTAARMYYSLDGITYGYTQLRGMSDGNYLYVGIFNTGGTKIDIAYKTAPNAEYTNLVPLSMQVPECFMINQITNCTFCELTLDKQYIYSEMKSPIELETYEGSTKVFMDGNATDTNIIIRNEGTAKIVNTYTDTDYTVYWKYVDGLGNLRVTLGGTTVEVDGKQEYATLRTQLNAPQELLYVGGYNLSIKDLMVVKGAKIDDLPYFEGSRQVGTLVLNEEGNKSYKITLVQGGSVLEQRDKDAIAFKDDNKHNVVVHKIVGVCPTKVD